MQKQFKFDLKIYYEDTDAGGVVFYANYLKYLERARTEAIYSLGYTNTKLKDKYDIIIIVKSCNINYIKSAKFEDRLSVYSKIKSISKASFVMKQVIKRKNIEISNAEIVLVAINEKGKPTKLPNGFANKLRKHIK
tara:strand:+ start:4251 stop:4658 length:408 start_codon:yes stop_codon:yes gene_type:complete